MGWCSLVVIGVVTEIWHTYLIVLFSLGVKLGDDSFYRWIKWQLKHRTSRCSWLRFSNGFSDFIEKCFLELVYVCSCLDGVWWLLSIGNACYVMW